MQLSAGVNIMSNVLIFGAGNTGKRQLSNLAEGERAIGFLDNNEDKWNCEFCGLPVYKPDKEILRYIKFDHIIVACVQAKNEIREQLLAMGVPAGKIKFHTRDYNVMPMFLNNLKELFENHGIDGEIAEVGVFQGETAALINAAFPSKVLYLFDTFEGFPAEDANADTAGGYSEALPGQFSDTSEKMVLAKMTYPQKVIIKKGYFPESASGVNDKFCFVRIDLDLYKPTEAALEFFHKRMVSGGIIIVHDYFGGAYKGIKETVDKYVDSHTGLSVAPMADRFSIVIVGY